MCVSVYVCVSLCMCVSLSNKCVVWIDCISILRTQRQCKLSCSGEGICPEEAGGGRPKLAGFMRPKAARYCPENAAEGRPILSRKCGRRPREIGRKMRPKAALNWRGNWLEHREIDSKLPKKSSGACGGRLGAHPPDPAGAEPQNPQSLG